LSSPIEFPAKLQCLFGPQRYTVLHGGRGGAKSWGVARSYLIRGAEAKRRFLCTREVQKSIRDSVHKLLSDQIQSLGLGAFYEVQQNVIKGANGTEFLFSGLSDQTAESIKSFEGVDDVWVEEAQAVSKRSWDILIPTIRKEGSRITITLNPELDTDETYVRFIENPPPDAVVVQINYPDNPWFPAVLEAERQHALATMPRADYDNIWEGRCKPAVTGAIYADEIAKAQEEGRIGLFPYDPALKVHVIFDLGWNDKMAIGLAQRHVSSLRCIEYIEVDHKTLDWCSAELKQKNLNWGKLWLPHDGAHGDYKTGKSAEQIMRELGWDVGIVPIQPVETGIKTARMAFGQLYIDKAKCERLIQCLKRYKRGVPVSTGEPGAPVHDEWSHGADMFRYMASTAPKMVNDDMRPIQYHRLTR
jgi:phage terminase large subunit